MYGWNVVDVRLQSTSSRGEARCLIVRGICLILLNHVSLNEDNYD